MKTSCFILARHEMHGLLGTMSPTKGKARTQARSGAAWRVLCIPSTDLDWKILSLHRLAGTREGEGGHRRQVSPLSERRNGPFRRSFCGKSEGEDFRETARFRVGRMRASEAEPLQGSGLARSRDACKAMVAQICDVVSPEVEPSVVKDTMFTDRRRSPVEVAENGMVGLDQNPCRNWNKEAFCRLSTEILNRHLFP